MYTRQKVNKNQPVVSYCWCCGVWHRLLGRGWGSLHQEAARIFFGHFLYIFVYHPKYTLRFYEKLPYNIYTAL